VSNRDINTDSNYLLEFKKYFKNSLPVFLQFIGDVLAISFSLIFQIAFLYATNTMSEGLKIKLNDNPIMHYFPVYLMLVAYWILLFYFSGLYKNWFERSPFEEIFTIIKVTFIGTCLFVGLLLLDKTNPRMYFLFHFFFLTCTLFIFRTIVRRLQRKLRRMKVISLRTLVIGIENENIELIDKLTTHTDWGYEVFGSIGLSANKDYQTLKNEIELFHSNYHIETVILSQGIENSKLLLEIVNLLSMMNIRVKIQPDLYHIFTGQTKTHNIYGIPFIEISPQLLKPWQELSKRIFDIIFSSLVIIIGSPLWLFIAVIIKLESKGNVIFKQMRMGKNNKPFKMYKFRSMVSGAEKKVGWTEMNDKRVTKFGYILRKSHLDEIPQFYNVLIGDMSVVGPRPETDLITQDIAKDVPYYTRRLVVRPGITGWWQVKYEPHVFSLQEIENRLKDDFYYIENMSLKFDLEIIIRTVWCVFKGHGQT